MYATEQNSTLYVKDAYNNLDINIKYDEYDFTPNIEINTCYKHLVHLNNVNASLPTQFDQLCLNSNWGETKLQNIDYTKPINVKHLINVGHCFNTIQTFNGETSHPTDNYIMFPVLRHANNVTYVSKSFYINKNATNYINYVVTSNNKLNNKLVLTGTCNKSVLLIVTQYNCIVKFLQILEKNSHHIINDTTTTSNIINFCKLVLNNADYSSIFSNYGNDSNIMNNIDTKTLVDSILSYFVCNHNFKDKLKKYKAQFIITNDIN